RQDDQPTRPARQRFHFWPRWAASELQLKHDVPDQKQSGERAHRWPHHSSPSGKHLGPFAGGVPSSLHARPDGRPSLRRWSHGIEPERQRADNALILPQQTSARRARGDVMLHVSRLGGLEAPQTVGGKVVDGMLALFSHGLLEPPEVALWPARARYVVARVP